MSFQIAETNIYRLPCNISSSQPILLRNLHKQHQTHHHYHQFEKARIISLNVFATKLTIYFDRLSRIFLFFLVTPHSHSKMCKILPVLDLPQKIHILELTFCKKQKHHAKGLFFFIQFYHKVEI